VLRAELSWAGAFLPFLVFFFLTHTALLLGSKTGVRRTHRKAAPQTMPMPRQCHALPMHAARACMQKPAKPSPARGQPFAHRVPKVDPKQRRASVTTASRGGRGTPSRQ
jgi:hypothetical protein